MHSKFQIFDIETAQIDAMMLRAKELTLIEEDYLTIARVVEAYRCLMQVLEGKSLSIRNLQKILFGAQTETTENVVGGKEETAPPVSPSQPEASSEAATPGDATADAPPNNPPGDSQAGPPGASSEKKKTKKRGHGRNGAKDFTGASRVTVSHPTLQKEGACPECEQGILYPLSTPGVFVRLVGRPPIGATVYECEKLRCNLCQVVFTAPTPPEAGTEKYDPTVASMIGQLKYGAGFPFNRLESLQRNAGIPLSASTQWDIVSKASVSMKPALTELIRQAAQGNIMFNDDTGNKILDMMGKRAARASPAPANDLDSEPGKRTGTFTSSVVSIFEGHAIALYFTGRKHAGENLLDVLRQRAACREPPIQMCDALSRNLPKEFETIVANCCAHARRKFVDIYEAFPQECRYVLEAFREVYHNDALAREKQLSDEERLAFHQAKSAAVMERLQAWSKQQLEERLVEPNSPLGQAINYLLKYWVALTLFLRKAGAPLDNNICERALKKAILHRKSALFFKSQNGATVGDLYMTLIHTCELNDADPLAYQAALLRHAEEVAESPADWMPWNYQEQLAAAQGPRANSEGSDPRVAATCA